jgi:hypothetical protein
MANFATLADLLSACVAQAKPDACSKLYAAATGPDADGSISTFAMQESRSCLRLSATQP